MTTSYWINDIVITTRENGGNNVKHYNAPLFYRTFYCIPQNLVFLSPCSFSFCLIACNIFPNTFKLSSPPRHFQGRDVESLITLLRILFQEMRRSLFINEKDQLTQ